MNKLCFSTALLGALIFLLMGCSSSGDKKPDPSLDRPVLKLPPPLDIPPDLNLPQGDSSLSIPESTAGATAAAPGVGSGTRLRPDVVIGEPVLPTYEGIRLDRAGGQRWLVIPAAPAQVWTLLHEFFQKQGLGIDYESRKTGIMESTWTEYTPQLQASKPKGLGKLFGGLQSTGLRNKYRIRLERGQDANTTEVYLSHRGMEEVVASGGGTAVVETRWQPRPSDPEWEAQMLRDFLVYVGVSQQRATLAVNAPPGAEKASVQKDAQGYPILKVEDNLESTWRRVGLALDRLGWVVEDRDRSIWTYRVRHLDPASSPKPRGFFAWLAGQEESSTENIYLVVLRDAATWTEVSLRDEKGAPAAPAATQAFLDPLHQQMR